MQCSICKKEVKIPYRLERYGIGGYLCSKCYSSRLREIYSIKY